MESQPVKITEVSDLSSYIDLIKDAACEKSKLAIDYFNKLLEERPKVVYAGVGIVGLIVFKNTIGVTLRHRFFAWFNSLFIKHKDENYEHFKKLLFADIGKIESHIPELKAKKTLKILEIGVGSGANFNHYPNGTHLIAVDPNPYFKQYFNANKQSFPNIQAEEIIQAPGENMSMVPDASVDAVVMTLVLCSVTDVSKVISEIHRVLVPGGKYFFMEHVKEWDDKSHRIRKWFQIVLTKTGIWPFFFDGCMLIRNPIPAMRNMGFSNIQHYNFYAPLPCAIFTVVSPHLRGIATK